MARDEKERKVPAQQGGSNRNERNEDVIGRDDDDMIRGRGDADEGDDEFEDTDEDMDEDAEDRDRRGNI